MIALLTSMVLIGAEPQPAIDGLQFSQLLRGCFSDYKDITLVYEGGFIDHSVPDVERFYQGVYSFRQDGATLLDMYTRTSDTSKPFSREAYSILGKRMESQFAVPDRGYSELIKGVAAPGSLNTVGSIERIFYAWYFLTLANPEDYGYEFQGWETIDGHRTLRVQLSTVPKSSWFHYREKPSIRLWCDIERGGHPLKVEFLYDDNVSMRAEGIILDRVLDSSGRSIWFPIKGKMNSYAVSAKGGIKYTSSPSFTETLGLVNGSLRLDQGLADNYFSVSRKDVDYHNQDLNNKRRLLELSIKKPQSPRVDPQGVKARLDTLLAEADSQSDRIEALDGNSSSLSLPVIIQLVAIVVAIITLSIVAIGILRKA